MTESKIAIKKEPKIDVAAGRAVAFTVGDTVDKGELQERARRGVPEGVLQRAKDRENRRREKKTKDRQGKEEKPRSSKSKKESKSSTGKSSPRAKTVVVVPPPAEELPNREPPTPSAAVLEAGGLEHDARDSTTVGVLSSDDLPPPLPDPCPSPAEVDSALTTFGEVEISAGSSQNSPLVSAGDLIARALVAPAWGHRALVPTLLKSAFEAVGATEDACTLDVDSLALGLRTCGALAAKLCDDAVLFVLRAGVSTVEIALNICVKWLAQEDLKDVEGAGVEGLPALATLALSDVAAALTRRLCDTSASARQTAIDGLRLLASSMELPVGVAAAGAMRDLDQVANVGDKELRARLSWVHQLVEEHGYDETASGNGVTGLTQDAVTALAVAGLRSSRAEVRSAATDVIQQAMRRQAPATTGEKALTPSPSPSLAVKGVGVGGGDDRGMSLFGVDATAALEASPDARAAAARHTLALIRVDAALAGQLAPQQLKALAAAVNVPLPSMGDWAGEYGPLLLTAAATEAKDDSALAEALAPDVLDALQPESALLGSVNVQCALSKSWQLKANAVRRFGICVSSAVARACAVRDLRAASAPGGARSGRRRVRATGQALETDAADLDGLTFDRMAQLLERLLGDSVPAVFAAAAISTARIMVQWSSRGRLSADAVVHSPATNTLIACIVKRYNSLSEPERVASGKAIQILLEAKALGVRAMANFLTGPLLDSAGWRGGASHLDVLRKCMEEDQTALAQPRTRPRSGAMPEDSPASPLASPTSKTLSSGCLPVDAVFSVARTGTESRHVRVRESAVAVLAELVKQFGPQVRSMLQQLKPTILTDVKQRAQRTSRVDTAGSSSARVNVGDLEVLSPCASDRPRTEPQRLPFGNDTDEFGVLSDFTSGGDFQAVRPSTVGDSPFTDFLASMSGSPSAGGSLSGSLVRGRKVFG